MPRSGRAYSKGQLGFSVILELRKSFRVCFTDKSDLYIMPQSGLHKRVALAH